MAFNTGPSQGFMNQYQQTMKPRVQRSVNRGYGGGIARSPFSSLPGNTGILGGGGDTGYAGGINKGTPPTMGPIFGGTENQPVMNTMPVGRARPQFDFAQMPQPTQTPMEDSQLWRAYNRLQGGKMAPRMLF